MRDDAYFFEYNYERCPYVVASLKFLIISRLNVCLKSDTEGLKFSGDKT